MAKKETIKILPDPTVSIAERDSYGYTYNGMLPLNQSRALELFDSNYAIFLLYPDNTEAMADNRDEIKNNNGFLFGIESDDWVNSREYREIAQTKENDLTIEQPCHTVTGMEQGML